MHYETVELFEGVGVEQQVEAFARCQLAGGVLLGDALLLDPPDQAERAAVLAEEQRAVLAAQTEVVRGARAARTVEDGLEVLRRPPLSEAELRATCSSRQTTPSFT